MHKGLKTNFILLKQYAYFVCSEKKNFCYINKIFLANLTAVVMMGDVKLCQVWLGCNVGGSSNPSWLNKLLSNGMAPSSSFCNKSLLERKHSVRFCQQICTKLTL